MTARLKSDIILSARGITNRFGAQTVHDKLNFDVARGEIIGIAGGSGSGKSLLLKTLIGLHRSDAGQVDILGKNIQQLAPAETAFLYGVLFQEDALFSSMSVLQNIMLPLREHTSLSESEQIDIAQIKLALAGLDAKTGAKYPSELSGGMTRRASMARALALDPLILFLDEPTSGLDPINAAAFDELLIKLNHALGVTIILVTHDLNTLFTICDRVGVLTDKKIRMDKMQNLIKSDDPWIKEFFTGPRGQGAAMAARSAHGNG